MDIADFKHVKWNIDDTNPKGIDQICSIKAEFPKLCAAAPQCT